MKTATAWWRHPFLPTFITALLRYSCANSSEYFYSYRGIVVTFKNARKNAWRRRESKSYHRSRVLQSCPLLHINSSKDSSSRHACKNVAAPISLSSWAQMKTSFIELSPVVQVSLKSQMASSYASLGRCIGSLRKLKTFRYPHVHQSQLLAHFEYW